MFLRFFKPKISPGHVETLLVTTNFLVNIGYQTVAFGKEKAGKPNHLVNKDSFSKARSAIPNLPPQRAFR